MEHAGTPLHQPSSDEVKARLATPVESLQGVRSNICERLHRLDLWTAGDLLFHFPRGYQDLSDERAIIDLEEENQKRRYSAKS